MSSKKNQEACMNPRAQDNVSADNIRERFHDLLTKVNKDRPGKAEIQNLKDLLYNNKEMELWRAVIGMGELAESEALDTILNGAVKGCASAGGKD